MYSLINIVFVNISEFHYVIVSLFIAHFYELGYFFKKLETNGCFQRLPHSIFMVNEIRIHGNQEEQSEQWIAWISFKHPVTHKGSNCYICQKTFDPMLYILNNETQFCLMGKKEQECLVSQYTLNLLKFWGREGEV